MKGLEGRAVRGFSPLICPNETFGTAQNSQKYAILGENFKIFRYLFSAGGVPLIHTAPQPQSPNEAFWIRLASPRIPGRSAPQLLVWLIWPKQSRIQINLTEVTQQDLG